MDRPVPAVVWERDNQRSGPRRVRAPAGDGVDPRGSVAAVPTAQADRECCSAHGGWVRGWVQYLGRVHAYLPTAGVARRDLGEFFDKLRRDHQQAESRKLYDSIHDPLATTAHGRTYQ